jgi:purine-binding chemotaxis protein CheW
MVQTKDNILSFRIDENLLAIPIRVVERVIRAVQVTPLGNAPKTILGAINYKGSIIPVLSLRKRLGYPERELLSSDRFLIIKTSARRLVLVVDEIRDIILHNHIEDDTLNSLPESIEAEGITCNEDGIILIFDPEKFVSSSEEINLDKALKGSDSKRKRKNPKEKGKAK